MFQRLFSQLLLPVLIIAVGAGGLVWLSAKDAPPERVAKQPPPLLVETVALEAGVSSFPIHISGNVVPRREVTLSAEVSGAVVFKGASIESGRHVQAGAVLLQIDPAHFELLVSQLSSELQQVASDVKRLVTEEKGTTALIQLAAREAEIATAASTRLKELDSKDAVTDAELEAVERTELQARNALVQLQNQRELMPIQRQRLQAQQKLTELKKQQAQLNLDRTCITAPFSGVITAVEVEQGNYVETGDVLFKLEDTSAVDVECSLRMDDLYWLWNSTRISEDPIDGDNAHGATAPPEFATGEAGQPAGDDAGKVFEVPSADATVTGEVAGRLFHWKGRLARYGGRGVNRKTRTVSCRVSVADPIREDAIDGPPTLLRGMYVTVTLNVTPRIRLVSIPARAVQPNGQVWSVSNDLLRGHSVQPAKVLPDSVLVRADSTDLKPGDHVVVTQLVTPLDGSRVRVHVRDQAVADSTTAVEDTDAVDDRSAAP